MSQWSYEHPYLTFVIVIFSLSIINNAVNVVKKTETKKSDEENDKLEQD